MYQPKQLPHKGLIIIALFFFIGQNTFGQNLDAPAPGTEAYQMAKAQGLLSPAYESSQVAGSTIQPYPESDIVVSSAGDDEGCFIDFDPATYTEFLPNDDGSVLVPLPFTFNHYGEEYNEVFINNNGNLTFNESLSAFTASGFPIDIPMIAPFWADVDTRGAGSESVYYLVTPTSLIVTWPGVGYFNAQDDLLNTFQVIITDGTDPAVAGNVAFYYEDMQWTTGEASLGVGGFGGVSSTVGANRGDGINFFQIGRFSAPGDEFFGPNAEDSGVDYLDFECYEFDISSGTNNAPLLQDISEVPEVNCVGDNVEIEFAFTDPELDQTLTTELEDPDGSGSSLFSVSDSNTVSGTITLGTDVPGTYNLLLTCTDNGDPQLSTNVEITYTVSSCEIDCEGTLNGNALPGTPCSVAGALGTWTDECECEPFTPGECTNYRYFLADNPTSGGDSKLYEYTLNDGDQTAVLEELLSVPYPIHIAYDAPAELVYIIRSSNGAFKTLDVSSDTGLLSEEVSLSQNLGHAVAAGFSPSGQLYIGSQENAAIYTVDKTNGDVNFFRNGPVQGGDLAFREDGNLYLATREFNGKVFELNTEEEVSLVNNVPPLVTGIAMTPEGEGLVSVRDRNRFYQGDDMGNQTGFYNLLLDGESFTTGNGDMASGCAESIPGGDCLNFVAYYTGYPENNSNNELYGISFTGENELELTLIDGFSTDDNHIAVSPDGSIYAVRAGNIDIFNPMTGTYIQQNIPIQNDQGNALSGFPAATFDAAGNLFLAKSSNNTVYIVEIEEGVAEATVAFSEIPINGGDLIATGTPEESILWYINRTESTLTNLLDETVIDLDLNEINGACLSADGRLLLANGIDSENGGIFALNLEDLSTEMQAVVGGPDIYFNGDMASRCLDTEANIPLNQTSSKTLTSLSVFPNPTKGITNIDYSAAPAEQIRIEVFDLSGRSVDILVNSINQIEGIQRVVFDGEHLPNGIYMVSMTSDSQRLIKKVMISK